jgi:hypothetical protein
LTKRPGKKFSNANAPNTASLVKRIVTWRFVPNQGEYKTVASHQVDLIRHTLHDDMTAALSNLLISVVFEYRTHFAARKHT